MKMIWIFGLLALVLSVEVVIGGVCPPEDHIKPCVCSNVTIECSSNIDFDLDLIFKSIANGKEPGSLLLAFELFILNNSKIDKLEDSIFQGITFERIEFLNNNQLTCVSPTAFIGLEKNLTTFLAVGTSFKSLDKDCNIFEALKTLHNLETISIIESNITEIPANAFNSHVGLQKALRSIDFSGGMGGQITHIGKNAFSTLQELEYIGLSSHKISSIDSYGFQFIEPIKRKLLIDLTNNNLTKNSFGINSFQVNDRITELKLVANPRIQSLAENIFEPFLMNKINKSDDNVIDLTGSPIRCSSENVWILEMETTLGLRNKLKNILSTDGQEFWKHSRKECSLNINI